MSATYPAVVFPSRGVVEVLDRPEDGVPEPAAGELRCRARTSLVSTGTESFCLEGRFDEGTFWQEWVQYPFSPGYSMVSDVLAVGAGVTGVDVGDRVATSTPHEGLFLATASEAVVVPATVTDDQACWTSLACTTQLGVRRAAPELGETAVVVGLGLLGQLVVQYLRLTGSRRIIAVDPVPARLDLAAAGGATDLLTVDAAAAVPAIAELTTGRMADVAFDVTGHPAVLAPTTEMVRPLGRVVLLGDSPTPSRQRLGPRVVGHSVSILGVHASGAPPVPSPRDPWTLAAMTDLFFDYVATGRMGVDHLSTHRFTPQQARAVYEALLTDRTPYLGVYLDWTPS